MTDEQKHEAYPKTAIIALYPTRGGWRASCTCGWMENNVHRSEEASRKVARKHQRQSAP